MTINNLYGNVPFPNIKKSSISDTSISDLLVIPQSQDNRDIISQCCLCKDFVSKTGEYITLTEDQIKEAYTRYLVSHGYCETCMNDYLKQEGLEKWTGKINKRGF